ncbi:MAG: ATP-binding protein [Pseudomonadota bacterium]
MYRFAQQTLIDWCKQKQFKPLLLRGARQVGKSYLVENFAKSHFDSYVTINFEFNRKFQTCFNTLDPSKIVNLISTMANQDIIPGKTLLFLDEIQECPNAILALRYFKEKMPKLHVIGAGSLLEFTLNKSEFRMPVGRIQSFYLTPCSFYEFLLAKGKRKLLDYLTNVTLAEGIDAGLHGLLLDELREYFVLGGMPEVIAGFVNDPDLRRAHTAQASLIEYYRKDFGKYDDKVKLDYLQSLFDKIPNLIGQKFKYVNIDPHALSRDLKPALQALIDAGLVYPTYHTSASNLPLQSTINERIFKLFFLDIGLVSYMSQVDIETLMSENLIMLNRGQLAEQFVHQELLAHSRVYEKTHLYYWQREKAGSTAEVDFIINIGTKIIPIEVKAGKTGRLKALQIFLNEKKLNLGIRVWQNQLAYHERILSIPLYLVAEIPLLIRTLPN